MEHREPPRINPGDLPFDGGPEQPGGRFRLRRFDTMGDRRHLDYRRAGLLVLAVLAVVASLHFCVDRGSRTAITWLAAQPRYQVPFDQVQLVDDAGLPNDPPRWYLGGSRAFLQKVRIGAREAELISELEVSPKMLRLAFEKYAWVEDVVRVEYKHGTIHVGLRYRQPVAKVKVRGDQWIMIDADATILPAEDVDESVLGPVIGVSGDFDLGGLAAPAGLTYGVKWKMRGKTNGLEEVDERIVAAAKLAVFLSRGSREVDAKRASALRITEIVVTDFFKPQRGLFVINDEDAAILWGPAPGSEPPGKPGALDKWAMLKHWEQTAPARFLVAGDFWTFTQNGLDFVCSHKRSRHVPSTSPERRVNTSDSATKTMDSG